MEVTTQRIVWYYTLLYRPSRVPDSGCFGLLCIR
jgi:hypothetical protein